MKTIELTGGAVILILLSALALNDPRLFAPTKPLSAKFKARLERQGYKEIRLLTNKHKPNLFTKLKCLLKSPLTKENLVALDLIALKNGELRKVVVCHTNSDLKIYDVKETLDQPLWITPESLQQEFRIRNITQPAKFHLMPVRPRE